MWSREVRRQAALGPLDSVPWYGTYIRADRISRRPNMSATTILSPASSRAVVAKEAVIHRMVMPHHTCPYGLKAKDLLRRAGYEVEDHHLTTREQTDAFKAKHGVAT